MTAKIILTDAYDAALTRIEHFILSQADDMSMLHEFWQTHDDALSFISAFPTTPATHPTTGDQSWPFGNGRYRVFFKHAVGKNAVYMTHIIDNRQANLEVYPGNSMPTYDED